MTELRLALRSLRRAPGLAAAVILTLGLGIGSVTTMFSITRGILRDLPVEEPGRLVHVAEIDRIMAQLASDLHELEEINCGLEMLERELEDALKDPTQARGGRDPSVTLS